MLSYDMKRTQAVFTFCGPSVVWSYTLVNTIILRSDDSQHVPLWRRLPCFKNMLPRPTMPQEKGGLSLRFCLVEFVHENGEYSWIGDRSLLVFSERASGEAFPATWNFARSFARTPHHYSSGTSISFIYCITNGLVYLVSSLVPHLFAAD